ncbi:MAG TPA: acylneuraminate cytidylyltransferase family protein [Thermoanaerobaculia bacterium]|jgi:CMP-N-acetylneuraminic acid synthetase|nr:acylneuraminate cytidylyltransferase family protein [Thermoanaerobaculia bacterium]
MKVLGLIPARGGSKGIPGKNVRPLGGRPLLAWTAEAALAARRLSRVVLSTDDEAIAEVGRQCGLDVPFLRPAELARDDTPTLPVVRHALEELKGFDAVCLLQPTSPFRRDEDIDACIAMLEERDLDAVVSVLPVPAEHNPHWVYFEDGGLLRLATGEEQPIPRRQELPPAFHRDGSVYVTRREVVMRGSLYGRRLGGYVMPKAGVNLDTPADWERAERLL